jgi:iron transport multicopper oxidase
MRRTLIFLHACLCFAYHAYAGTVTYTWNLNWVSVNPDGELPRPAVGINGKWPNPPIEASVGDRIVINLHNQLGNETASLHFHGIYQQGSNGMDGPPGVTQCEIPPGVSFTYDFVVRVLASPSMSGLSADDQIGQPTWLLLVPLPYFGAVG